MVPVLHRVEAGYNIQRVRRKIDGFHDDVATDHLHAIGLMKVQNGCTELPIYVVGEIVDQSRFHAKRGASNGKQSESAAEITDPGMGAFARDDQPNMKGNSWHIL